jgi:hypothetical protein
VRYLATSAFVPAERYERIAARATWPTNLTEPD